MGTSGDDHASVDGSLGGAKIPGFLAKPWTGETFLRTIAGARAPG